jgi:hypothetical protein
MRRLTDEELGRVSGGFYVVHNGGTGQGGTGIGGSGAGAAGGFLNFGIGGQGGGNGTGGAGEINHLWPFGMLTLCRSIEFSLTGKAAPWLQNLEHTVSRATNSQVTIYILVLMAVGDAEVASAHIGKDGGRMPHIKRRRTWPPRTLFW